MNKNEFWNLNEGFILASGSPQRRALLEEVRLFPDEIISPETDESLQKNELPADYVKRIAYEKAFAVSKLRPNKCILAADTVLAVGRRIIRKAQSEEEVRKNLTLLSRQRHRVLTGLCIIGPKGEIIQKISTSFVKLKRLDETDIRLLLESKEWQNVAGYKIEGILQSFVQEIRGSYSGIVGLPLYETTQALRRVLK